MSRPPGALRRARFGLPEAPVTGVILRNVKIGALHGLTIGFAEVTGEGVVIEAARAGNCAASGRKGRPALIFKVSRGKSLMNRHESGISFRPWPGFTIWELDLTNSVLVPRQVSLLKLCENGNGNAGLVLLFVLQNTHHLCLLVL